MRSCNFYSINFLLIWYKDSFRVPDMNFEKKNGGHRVHLITLVTGILWFISQF